MTLKPQKTSIREEASGEEHAVRLVRDWLTREGIYGENKADDLIRDLKAGPPRLVILQQGRVEELTDTLAKLQKENEAFAADKSAQNGSQQRILNLAREAISLAETLFAAGQKNTGEDA